jgi:hypothetical protein
MEHRRLILRSFCGNLNERFNMKKNKLFVIGGVLCCFFALLAGCASSKLVNIWSDPSFHSPSLNKMLVLSISKNSVQRRIWEDAFSIELAKHKNIAATASYHLFPDVVPDTNNMIQITLSNGFDGILICRRLPPEMNAQYTPGYETMEQSTRYDRRREKFVTYYRNIEHAATIDTEKIDIRTIDVWATRNEGQMIWSATSLTPEPNLPQEVRPEIVKLVMSELTQQGIIASER